MPSHIVPPKKKKEEPPAASRRQSSVSVASASSAVKLKEKEKGNQQQRKLRPYRDVKREMLARNKDPSRDVLQTMLNPYAGLEPSNERTPHPFQIRRPSKTDEESKLNVPNPLSMVGSQSPNSSVGDVSALKEVLEAQFQ